MASQTRIQFVDSVINAMVDNSRYPQIAGQPMPDAMRSEMENSMARLANPIYDCITSFVYDSPGVFPDERVKANALDPTTGYLGDKIDSKTLKLDETTFKIYVDTVPVAESAKLGGIMIGSQPYLFMTSNNISLNVDTTNDLSGGSDKVPTSRAVKLYLGNVIDGITSGVGNMFKATYDVNDTGVVDDSERLNNQLPSYYLNYNNLSNRPTDAPSDGIMYARKDASWISLLTNFYTETEIDDLLTYKANATHLHTESDISDLKSYIEHATSDGNYYSSRNGVWESFTPNIVQDLSGLVPYTGATTDVSLGAHNLIVDTDTLFINSIGHYVGIGIATPTSKLHVAGKQILSYGVPSGALSIGADVNLTTRSTNVRKLGVIAGIDYTNTKNIELFTTDSVSTVSNLVYFGGRNGGSSYAATHIYFTTAPNTSTTGGTTRMFINNSGRVGINTVSPASLLTIIGSSGTITDGLTFNTAGTIGIYIDGSNNLTFTDTVTGTKTLADLAASGSGVTPIDNILDWNGTAYAPYASYQANSFYSGTTDPTGTTRLNYDGYLRASQFCSNSTSTAPGIISYNTTTGIGLQAYNSGTGSGISLSNTGLGWGMLISNTSGGYGLRVSNSSTSGYGIFASNTGSSYGVWINNSSTSRGLFIQNTSSGVGMEITSTSSGNAVNIQKTSSGIGLNIFNDGTTLTSNPFINISRTQSGSLATTSDFINITDNPTTAGTISGKVLTATIGSVERISLNPRVSNGASAVAYMLDTHNALSTSGAKLFSLLNNGTEKFYIDYNGNAYSNGVLLGSPGIIQYTTNLSLRPMNEGTVTGNARGANSVDLQTKKSLASHVGSGDYSTISGAYNTASGGYSTVFGGFSTASGEASIAIGAFNTSSGIGSTTLGGQYNTSSIYGETVIGVFSNLVSGSAIAFVSSDSLFRIGNGTGTSARSDAFRVNKNGNVIISGTTTSTQYILSTLNTAPSSSTSTGTLGEIRITSTHIYVCTATNTWVRAAIATW